MIMCTVLTASDSWRHSWKTDVRRWRETMGALCCWLPSSLQIGRLRGDRVGWREGGGVRACVRACAVARIQWMDLEGERRENSGSERLSPTNKTSLLGRHSEQCVTWTVTPPARQHPGRQNHPSPTKGMRLYLAKQTRVTFNYPLCILFFFEK